MEARIDGCLRIKNGKDTFAIVEVKPRVRNRAEDPAILRQESAQMAAWIYHDAKNRAP
jgi:hypothetical protein